MGGTCPHAFTKPTPPTLRPHTDQEPGVPNQSRSIHLQASSADHGGDCVCAGSGGGAKGTRKSLYLPLSFAMNLKLLLKEKFLKQKLRKFSYSTIYQVR